MRKMKQILPLFLMVVLFVTSVLPVYATGTTSYDYNWEGQTEVAGNGITVDLNESTENEFTLKSETENNFVLLAWNDKNNAAKLQADISEVDPTQDMVFEVSLRCATKADTGLSKDYNTPTFQVMLYGKDAKNDTVKQQLVKIGNNSITGVAGVDASNILTLQREKWDDLVFVLNPVEKSLQLYLNDSPNASYTGTYTDEFVSLTKIEVWVSGGTPTRALCIDNIKAYNVAESVEDDEASIDGVGYATLEAAVEAAASTGATVTLEADATLPSNYDQAITYDLNGHTLTCDTFTGINATVVDSSDGNNGLLKIPQDKLVFDIKNDNGGYIPVWDSTSEGYRFSSVTISDIEYTSTDALVFAMRPAFDSSNIEKLVAAGCETGMVRVGVRITWPGSDESYDLPLSDAWLSTMYGGNTAKGVKLTISGGETITEFTATTIVWSTQCPFVVIAGETHTYPAKVE